MLTLSWPAKDPDEKLDFQIDWADRIADDPIIASVWTVPVGLTITAEFFSDTVTTVWLTSGTLDADYEIRNNITTMAGRILEQTVVLPIRAR